MIELVRRYAHTVRPRQRSRTARGPRLPFEDAPTLDMPLVVTNDQPEETIAAIRKMVTVIAAPTLN